MVSGFAFGFTGWVRPAPQPTPRYSNSEDKRMTLAFAPEDTAVDPFQLDVQIITDVPVSDPLAACGNGTDDGCEPTCASACISKGA